MHKQLIIHADDAGAARQRHAVAESREHGNFRFIRFATCPFLPWRIRLNVKGRVIARRMGPFTFRENGDEPERPLSA